MSHTKLIINEQSIKTELESHKDKPYDCLFEYIWNSFDAQATEVRLDFDLPENGMGYVSKVKINDNGTGWDFDDDATTNNFISSIKTKRKNNTLPHGQYGKGRYAFIWISEKLEVLSKERRLLLHLSTEIKKENSKFKKKGAQVIFHNISEAFSNALTSDELNKRLILEFGWFLLENEKYKILINGVKINIDDYIKDSKEYLIDDFPQKIKEKLDKNFVAKIILWKEKPLEYSKFYFLNQSSVELFKKNTGLNKKSDGFWHSVYIRSSLFNDVDDEIVDEDDIQQSKLSFSDKKNDNQLKNQVISFLKEELVKIRRPHLKLQSESLIAKFKKENLMPDLTKFGIYDEDTFQDLLKSVYTIAPSLFVDKSNSEKKFICAAFAGLLSTQDDILIKTILEQLQELSEDEQNDLLEILKRTSFSNIIKTIKEIDHRIEVIDKLKTLISEHEEKTLEVNHLQKILDENFWLFGEQFRLFSSTEGALKNVLIKYAKEVLEINDPELEGKPNGEVDLFLTKTETIGEIKQQNIIIEIKRASKKLGKKEYDQIEGYLESIATENLCNSENQYWEFYLIGKDYDDHINNKIDSAKNHGQKEKGLCYFIKDGRVKIYVRKWSDILEVEWGNKMKYLKENLKIQAKKAKKSPQAITKDLIK